MVKRFGSMFLAALFVVGTLAIAQAQESQPATQESAPSSPAKQGHWKHGKQDPAQHAQLMGKKLNLTSEQQSKVQGILEDQQKQMQALQHDKSLSKKDRGEKFADLHQATSSQIRAVLNEDQQKKFDQMEQQQQQQMAAHHAKKDGSQPSAEPQPKQ